MPSDMGKFIDQRARSSNSPPARPAPRAAQTDGIGRQLVKPARLLDTLTSAQRKEYPVTTGVLDYFPDAIAMVAHISFLGNQKHNPGEELHWARGKSMDHADCCGRHLEQRGTLDTEGIRHSAQLAWRSLALLQEELEKEFGLALPQGARRLDKK